MSSVVFGFIEVVYGKQPVVLAAFNRKKEVVSVIFTFGETTSAGLLSGAGGRILEGIVL
ncbi:hypothetical protein DGWBC_0270 [Dehalogenimonas sp. WBC-2]|nr:hypothetical protein DGWBC_0270 [Dehalogenimonas sp. WBC-2]